MGNASLLFGGSRGNEDPFDAMLNELAERAEGLKGDQKAAYDDLEFYNRWVIGHGDPDYQGNSRFHKRLYQALQYTNDDLIVLAPRGSGKSQAISATYVTWMIGRNPLVRILIAYASMEAQGKPFARQIDTILTKNERYISIFGELKPRDPVKWDASEKIVNRPEPPGGMKDATLTIVGMGSAVPSKRSDIIIGDDIVTQDTAYSKVLQDRTHAFWESTLFPTLVPTGRQIIVGTLWAVEDFYHKMIDSWGHVLPQPLVFEPEKLKEQAAALGLIA